MQSASTPAHPVTNVVISGAGPAGLLLAGLLLHRNEQLRQQQHLRQQQLQQQQQPRYYRVTLVEPRPDLGLLDVETELKRHRSWMLALAGHGLEALKTLPGLYDAYVADVGVKMLAFSLYLGGKEVVNQSAADDLGGEEAAAKAAGIPEAFVVDRNFVVAAMSRFLLDRYGGGTGSSGGSGDGGGSDPLLDRRYGTKLMYVDDETRRVLLRNAETGVEEYLPYDLLVGCDGVRSTVREALVKRDPEFQLEVTDIFNQFKAVSVATPPTVSPHCLTLLPGIFPLMQGIALPQKDGNLNITIGVTRNAFDDIAPELRSDDPKVVAGYVRANFAAFGGLVDCDDFARQWASSRWNRTGMVHCSSYHSVDARLVLMGDAAHATSPSIGMGMNTALRDAQKFYELLVKHGDDLDRVLPEYSTMRVKEGNALSDLALHLYCFDPTAQLVETLHMVVRGKLHGWFGPKIVSPHPQALIGDPQWGLADVYQLACDQGIIQKHRAINDRIRQEHFEVSSGMRRRKPATTMTAGRVACRILAVLAALVGTASAVASYVVLYRPDLMMAPMEA